MKKGAAKKKKKRQAKARVHTFVKKCQLKYVSLCVCPFRPHQTLAGCTNPAMIAVQYLQNLDLNNLLIYTVQQFVKITAFTKNDPPNGIQNYSARF